MQIVDNDGMSSGAGVILEMSICKMSKKGKEFEAYFLLE